MSITDPYHPIGVILLGQNDLIISYHVYGASLLN